MRGGWARAVLLLGASAMLLASCGNGSAPEVPQPDADAIFRAFTEEAQPLFRQGCFNVRRPVSEGTVRAYSLLLRVAHRDPDAVIQSPDVADLHWSMAGYVAARAGDIGYCIARGRSPAPGWRRLKARLDQEVSAMERRH